MGEHPSIPSFMAPFTDKKKQVIFGNQIVQVTLRFCGLCLIHSLPCSPCQARNARTHRHRRPITTKRAFDAVCSDKFAAHFDVCWSRSLRFQGLMLPPCARRPSKKASWPERVRLLSARRQSCQASCRSVCACAAESLLADSQEEQCPRLWPARV